MGNNKSISKPQIESLIFNLRGTQVIIDLDLAEIYHVETRVLNQAVKRNIDRFPERFRFQLNHEEIEELKAQIEASNSKSQIVTLNQTGAPQGGNIKYLPYAINEQGVAMLAAVLRSDVAVQVSIQIMDAFVEMRKFIANYGGLQQRMEGIEDPNLSMDRENARKNYSERKLRFLAPLEMTLTRQCGGGGKGGEAAFPSPLKTAKAVISSASEKSLFERNQSFTALALF